MEKFYLNTLNFMYNMEIINRKSVFCELKKFDYIAKADDFIEITEWSNGEGYDITINQNTIQLTHGQIDAINYLTKHLSINS